MKKTIMFSGTCLAGDQIVLVSQRITTKYITKKFVASFAMNTNRTLKIRYFISPDPTAPSTGTPTGVNILASYGEEYWLAGDNEQKSIEHEVEVSSAGSYIKIYAQNEDGFDHTIDCYVIIDTIE